MTKKVYNSLSIDLIGVTGLARSGKDTAGKYLSDKYGIPTYAFASPLKTTINKIFLWDERHSDGDLKEETVVFKMYKGWRFKLVSILRKNLGEYLDKYDRYELLKLFIHKVLPKYKSLFSNESLEDLEISPREVYQRFGTEFGRYIDKELWIKLADKKYKETGCLIITDVRFENEAKFIRDNGGRVLHIKNANAKKVNNHSSEKGIAVKNKDIIIHNDGDLNDFYNKLSGLDYVI